jgi:hypothetical protein
MLEVGAENVMEKVVIGVVDNAVQAQTAVERLQAMGFSPRGISVLFPDQRGSHDFGFEHHTKAPEGALVGVLVGWLLGGAIGVALAVGLFAIPGLEVLRSSSPLLTSLAVAAAVALPIAAIGAIIGMSVPEIEAKHYAGKTRKGSILVAAHTDNREEVRRAREVLRSVSASDVAATTEAPVPAQAKA